MRRRSSALEGPAPWGGNLVTRSRGASLTLLRRSGIDALPRLDFMSLMLGLQLCVYAAWQLLPFRARGLVPAVGWRPVLRSAERAGGVVGLASVSAVSSRVAASAGLAA